MTRARLSGYAVLAGVFLLGAVAGAGASYAYVQREVAADSEQEPGALEDPRRLRALVRVLRLRREQREQVREVIARHRRERRELTRAAIERCGEPLIEHKQQVDAEIRALLTPEQQHRFDELLRKQREKLR